MKPMPPVYALVLTIAVAAPGSSFTARRQDVPALQALTVPEGRLPPDCRLKESDARGAAPEPFSSNPWIGSDRRALAMIRNTVEGIPPVPDGPPLDRRLATQYALSSADGVAEGYRATYAGPEGFETDVFAVKFETEALARDAYTRPSPRTPGVQDRVAIGPLVARVVAKRGRNACFEAILEHIRSFR
jgi:hypothetical protein